VHLRFGFDAVWVRPWNVIFQDTLEAVTTVTQHDD
jgi:hypothetical protein